MKKPQPARILSIDPEDMTMVIDWGTEVLNHDIPLYILENPHLSMTEMREVIEDMRPPEPVRYEIPEALLQMVEPVQEEISEQGVVIEEEVLL